MPLEAQRLWLDPMPDKAVGLVTTVGAFNDDFVEFPTLTLAGRVRLPLADGVVLTGELPVSHARSKGFFDSKSESGLAVGNPWVGVEYHSTPTLAFEVGLRPSLWSPNSPNSSLAWSTGTSLDFDRWEAWLPGVSTLRAAASLGLVPQKGLFGTGRIGGSGWVGRDGRSTEILADYGARIGVASQGWTGWVGIFGHILLTSISGSFADRTVQQGELVVEKRGGGLAPRLSLRRDVLKSNGYSVVDLIVRFELQAAL